MYSKVLPATNIVESSANIFNFWGSFISKDKSFIKMIKRKGLRMLPASVTTREILRKSEVVLLTNTACFLIFKYELNQPSVISLTP